MFQTFLLLLLLASGLCLAVFTLVFLLSKNIAFNLDTGASGDVQVYEPEVSWAYYALITAVVFIAFVPLLRRLVAAWKNRSRHARR